MIAALVAQAVALIGVVIWISTRNNCAYGHVVPTTPAWNHVSVWNGTDYTLTCPLPVAAGGTGVKSFVNTNSRVSSGTSATGSVQTLAGGSKGQVLTSSGTGMLPTWKNITRVSGIQTINKISPSDGDFALKAGSGITVTPETNSISLTVQYVSAVVYQAGTLPYLHQINIAPQATDLGLNITLTLKQISVVTCTSWRSVGNLTGII